MKPKDILKEEEGELKDIKKFHYDHGSLSRLGLPGDDDETEAEARERLREINEESKGEDLCFRCLENSDGKIRTNVKGLEFCTICGTPNSNYKGE